MARVKYRIGDEVAHIDNIEFKLRVRDFVYEEKQLRSIICTWWEGNKLQKNEFHSHELVPWGVAKQGVDQVNDYLKSIETEKFLNNIPK